MENKQTYHRKKTQILSSLLAVAKNTITQALRMKVAVVFIILLLVLLPILGLTATGDETMKGRLQTFVGYGFSLTSLLLCLLAIIVSIYTITGDIKNKQIHSVITKPIRRYQLLLGKMLGVLILNSALLLVFSVIIYTLAIFLPGFFEATPPELVQLDNEFFTARQAIPMPQKDVTVQVQQRYAELEKLGQLPADYSKQQIIDELTNQAQLAYRAADVGYALVWEFENIKPLTTDFFIRFKYEVPQYDYDGEIYGEWIVGDPKYVKDGQPVQTPIYDQVHKNSVKIFNEIIIPATVIPKDGRLAVKFGNYPANDTSIIFPTNGVALLYKAGSFNANFVRAAMLILLRVIFLTSLATMTSTFVSFPVAVLVCLVVFATVSASSFIIESFTSLGTNVSIIYSYSVKIFVQLMPAFDKFNPAKFMIDAQLLSWFDLGKFALLMVCIPSGLLLILAFVIFSRREIAKIII